MTIYPATSARTATGSQFLALGFSGLFSMSCPDRHETLFVRQFSRVGQSGVDVVGPKGWIARQDLVPGSALGKTVEDHRDGDSGSGCANLAGADLWTTAEELMPSSHVSSLRGRRPCVHSMILTLRPHFLLTSSSTPATMVRPGIGTPKIS